MQFLFKRKYEYHKRIETFFSNYESNISIRLFKY